MKKILFSMLIILFLISGINANTTRDLKSGPDYNSEKIKKNIILYLNLERVNMGNPPLIINRILNSAAQWHSDYMAEAEILSHITGTKGMHDVEQRVVHFGEKIDRYSEIISGSYSVSADGVTSEKKKDSEGEYVDFGKVSVYWLSETEIAMAMIKKILADPRYTNYLSNEKLNSIGGGVSGGKINGIKAWYASFAIVEKKGLLRFMLKMNFKKEIIKKKENGKEIDETVVRYSISGFAAGSKVALLAINPAGVYKTFDSKVPGNEFFFRIDDTFRSKLADDEKLYFATYDEENDTYYPVLRIEVLK